MTHEPFQEEGVFRKQAVISVHLIYNEAVESTSHTGHTRVQ